MILCFGFLGEFMFALLLLVLALMLLNGGLLGLFLWENLVSFTLGAFVTGAIYLRIMIIIILSIFFAD